MRLQPVDEPCQARRGLDYASVVYVSATDRHQREVFEHCCALGEEIESSWDWSESGRSAHFGRCFTHPTGMRVELTEHGSACGRNPGMTLLSVPGACFYLQEEDALMTMLWKLVSQDGFKHFTRLDFMNTELEPEWDMERVHQGVVDGLLWVKGHRSYEPRGEVAADGSCATGRTLYWGSPRSERRGRTYDKAKQSGWSTPAIRDEVQLRGDWAHAYGRQLREVLRAPGGSAAMSKSVEELAVKALNQHLQYWETNGADPSTDKNWTRKAKPADWYTERIGKPSQPLRKAPKVLLDLESTVDWGVRQYGRAFAVWVEKHTEASGLPQQLVANVLFRRFWARLQPEDLLATGLVDDEAGMAEAMEYFRELRDELAISSERGWFREE